MRRPQRLFVRIGWNRCRKFLKHNGNAGFAVQFSNKDIQNRFFLTKLILLLQFLPNANSGTKATNHESFESGRWQFICDAGILGFVSFTLVSAYEKLFAIATYFQRMDGQGRFEMP